ncbi:hypothetical protein [Maribacter aquivivus]|uniref:hypothetical protein n=1 Tax=Maribacter aquivivus TaxID=228958 RepID=UPI002492FA79|nr:hypothetical protein [Maribacter aquivivus]
MEYNSPKFKKWLDTLQQESWQLELIISGFAIYGLFSAYEPLDIYAATAMISDNVFELIFWGIPIICCQILIFNLVLHVLLRGLWIGAIGLRYVSGDIEYDKLNYSEKFTTYLKKRVGSFDEYISKLETYCSVIFAVSFLLVFYVIGFFTVTLGLGLIVEAIDLLSFLPESIISFFQIIIRIIILTSALIVFIDFLGQGFLKKRKWTTKLYFPIYWIFSKLTLSFLYRPLTYNFLDNKLGRRLGLLLLPVYLVIILISGFTNNSSNYLQFIEESSEHYSNKSNYENELTELDEFIDFASIPSKVVNTPYLRVFIVYNKVKEEFVFDKNNDLKPENDIRGFSHSIIDELKEDQINEEGNLDIKVDQYLSTLEELYTLKIDSTKIDYKFTISKNAKDRIGFETYLNIRNLEDGKHLLKIIGPSREHHKDTTEIINLATIPFWYFPENREPSNKQNKNILQDTLTTN